MFHTNLTDGILTVTLDINERNSFTESSFGALSEKIGLAEDPAVRVVVLQSAREGFFSNGLDPELFLDRSPADIERNVRALLNSAERWWHCPVPTISCINGHSMGGGSVFAIFSDFRFISDSGARIAFPEINIAMNFPSVGFRVLSSIVGAAKARELLLTGEALKGKAAEEIGLVNASFAKEDLSRETMKFAAKLAKLTPESLRGMKTAFRDSLEITREDQERDVKYLTQTILTANTQEGFRALQEGRRPRFQ